MTDLSANSGAALDLHTTAGKLADLHRRLDQAQDPGSERAKARRAERGLPSARQRMHMLFDEGTFVEMDQLAKTPGDPKNPIGDGVVIGYGKVDGRPVAAFSHDQTVAGGTVGEMFGRKVVKLYDFAATAGMPVVGINDSGGARIQDAATSLAWYAELGRHQDGLCGMVPQISMILGKCVGGAVYAPANTDVLVGVEDQAYMFVTGPEVLRPVTGETTSAEDLGGAVRQATWGNLHHVAKDEKAAFDWVKRYLSFMPTTSHQRPPVVNPGLEPELTPSDLELETIIPDSDNAGYDIHDVILRVFDDGDFLEYAELWAQNLVCGFARVDGSPVGVVANQPMFMAGTLDTQASEKAARFVRLCNGFNIPLVFLVDVPGILPGLEEERIGTIRRSGKFIYAYVEAAVPKVTIVLRKAYGGAWAVMGSKQLGADFSFAWPTARLAVMGAESAAAIIKRREIEEAGENGPAIRQAFIDFYNQFMATPWLSAERGYIDGVIEPKDTRLLIRKCLSQLQDKELQRAPRRSYLMPI
ncbi:acyl-CoA carboxylase subunit beta [Tsukamurella sp. 8F]|uniref:acyl-CoA carboxylase subunit beta n=1 Tax=unclassified Tsukamurella TaxID=2633480 RepID=UPI0023B8F8EF|nr:MULTISPECIES: acyl-CoA carboxylase subunit beta [unclassified Tsukamurella]MDF0530778.1 acyl-CoA carboxylase subunit beta [Tsukamurella sp. 8J]MDF0588304.1 acyl-CoA carboxylase subunit beta [Tsukamurella sp. 8F]